MNEPRLIRDRLVLVLDTETTGPEPETARIVELGAAYFVGGELVRSLSIRINPGEPIPAGASEVHGIFDADVADAPTFAQVAPRLLKHMSGEWARDNLGIPPAPEDGDSFGMVETPLVVGYNILRYDAIVIDAEFVRANVPVFEPMGCAEILDPIAWSMWENRGGRNKLTEVCEDVGISLKDAHAASADAVATGRLLFRLIQIGIIPDNDTAAMREMAWRVEQLEAERAEFGHYFYRCRAGTGALLVGFGKHKAALATSVPRSYWQFVLGKFTDLHPGAEKAMRELAGLPEKAEPVPEATAPAPRPEPAKVAPRAPAPKSEIIVRPDPAPAPLPAATVAPAPQFEVVEGLDW